ncbi:MAG: hypothetical protein K2X47_16570 [Bdellovibrionales bacterium]|nr:hypothetical protein [Bdellovibrionales bacterium]
MMNATLMKNDVNENFNSNGRAAPMTSTIYSFPAETPSILKTVRPRWQDVTASLWQRLRIAARKLWATHTNDLSYEQWNRLEYRNELAGRIGEKMNPHYIR